MEDKINIAEILRDMPNGTKLYSPLFGEVKFKEVVSDNTFPIKVLSKVLLSPFGSFTENGFYYDDIEDAEVMLLPSCEMRDWSKFFKHGDVVRNPHNEMIAVFDGWANDDYTEFNTTINYYKDHTFGEEEVCDTECFVKANDEQKTLFIAAAEKHYGGKYNPETLQVDPVKVSKPMCSFKPFDKVLVRCNEDSVWRCELFSHYNTFNKQCPYVCLSSVYKYCIPYEGNQHLLGTTNNPK